MPLPVQTTEEHYPFHVVAGLCPGGAVSGLGWLLARRPLARLVCTARSLPVVDRLLAPTAQRLLVMTWRQRRRRPVRPASEASRVGRSTP